MDTADTLRRILARLDALESRLTVPDSPHLTAREAAAYLRLAYSTFRKKAVLIPKQATGRYRREDLDAFAASRKPKRQR